MKRTQFYVVSCQACGNLVNEAHDEYSRLHNYHGNGIFTFTAPLGLADTSDLYCRCDKQEDWLDNIADEGQDVYRLEVKEVVIQ